jgi:acetyltransferase-like isoleucine patch superfamily enzyme
MAFYSQEVLQSFGFLFLGKSVLISEKCSIYDPASIKVDDNTRIDDFTVISGNVTIGKNVHISTHCFISSGKNLISICDFAGISSGVKLFGQSDDYSGEVLTNPTVPPQFKKTEVTGNITIGKHVIIGANSVVLPGVEIGEGCAVGAMSLVKQSTKPWGIYVGVPVKRLKERSRKLLKSKYLCI